MPVEGGIGWGDSYPANIAPAGDGPHAPIAHGFEPKARIAVTIGATATVDTAFPPVIRVVVRSGAEIRLASAMGPVVRVVTSVLAYGRPTPPLPVPGPAGNHCYEVIVCDKWGIALGQILSAVPQQIEWSLDDLGSAQIDFWIEDASALIFSIYDIPGVKEIQIWRDHELIWWGWPTSATFDATQVHLTCSGLLWPLGQIAFGPEIHEFLVNPQFEIGGLDGWIPFGAGMTASVETEIVALGSHAARLTQPDANTSSYLYQDVTVSAPAAEPTAYFLAGWVYIDSRYAFTGPAAQQYGLVATLTIASVLTQVVVQQITNETPVNTWTRFDCDALVVPAGETGIIQVRLYAPGGSVIWDALQLTVEESVGSQPAGSDVVQIIKSVMSYAQDPTRGKADLGFRPGNASTAPFGVIGPEAAGVVLQRNYQFADNGIILDALNEFPTIGILDYEITWDRTGHFRAFEVFVPAKGSVKYNFPIEIDVGTVTDLQGSIDGSAAGTAQRVLGQGSSGSSEDIGFAVFPSFLGGRSTSVGVLEQGSNILTADLDFTDADIGQGVYSLTPGILPIGTVITGVTSSSIAEMSNDALANANPVTVGVGGIVLDVVQSALPDQPISTLQESAQTFLLQAMRSPLIPSPRLRADGPRGFFGNVETGDVVPVYLSYGWLKSGLIYLRVTSITLYPVSEEMEVTLTTFNAQESFV